MEITEVYLSTRRAEKEFFEESCRLFGKWSSRWLASRGGKRKFEARLKELKDEWPSEGRGELAEYVKKDIVPYEMLSRLHQDRIIAQRKGLARLSIDPNLSDFQYLSPPVTCSSDGVANWTGAICWPFKERIEWNEVDWAGKVLQEVGCLGRMVQAPELKKNEVLERINKLEKLTSPERLTLDAELRLFKWAIESFPRSLIGHLMSTHGLRKCQHLYCEFGPYFFPSRDSQVYCTDKCQDRQANIRYYSSKKSKKTGRRKTRL